jgi:polyisoprenoid-binding protein YceI
MKSKLAILSLAAPVAFGAYVAFYPGRAFAEPRMPKLTSPSSMKQAGNFTVDSTHTSVGFEIKHMGLSSVQGRFTGLSGVVVEDPKDLAKSHVDFQVQTSTIDTAVPARDHHLASADFFDVAKYPTITFKSTKIAKLGDHYVAYGNLTMKDVTKQIAIPFKHYGPIKDPFGSTRMGIVAEPITIKRSEYHVNWNAPMPDGSKMLPDEVTVKLSLEATLNTGE